MLLSSPATVLGCAITVHSVLSFLPAYATCEIYIGMSVCVW
jgi:hypothetical protein